MEQIVATKEKLSAEKQPDPSKIMQIGMGFMASKVLLSAVKFRLFTLLSARPMSGPQIKEHYGFKTTLRHVYDWLDALVSLGMLQREGTGDAALYANAVETGLFLDQDKPTYIGGILEMSNSRLYRFWNNLEDGLLTGLQQNEAKEATNMHFFEDLYKDADKLQEFMNAMSGIQLGNFIMLANKFNFSQYNTLVDLGGADGALSVQVSRRHPSIHCITFDLPPASALAEKNIARLHLDDHIKAQGGNFLTDPLPKASIYTLGNILHGLNEDTKQQLVNKVFQALPANGVMITIENIIDNDRRQNTFGFLMSLNMLIENSDAFDYTMDDFDRWARAAGFERTEIIPLTGPTSAAIAYK